MCMYMCECVWGVGVGVGVRIRVCGGCGSVHLGACICGYVG